MMTLAIGVCLLVLVSAVLGKYGYDDFRRGFDDDRPEHVNRNDWARVTRMQDRRR